MFEAYGIKVWGVRGLRNPLVVIMFVISLVILPLLVTLVAMWFPGTVMSVLLCATIAVAIYELYKSVRKSL